MRVLSYNILDGGTGRADPLAEVILAQRADVVVLVEADDPDVVARIARRAGMDAVVGRGPGRTAAAVLSRWPIRSSVNHAAVVAGLSRSCLEATVLAPDGRAWPVCGVHLPAGATDAAEDARLAELAVVLDCLARHRSAGRPHLLCGDFNANASYHRVGPARCQPATGDAMVANGARLPTRVVDAVLAAGYADAYHARHGDEPAGTFTTQRPGQRVDYVFAHGVRADQIADAWIEQDRLAKYASDHFPIGAEVGGWES